MYEELVKRLRSEADLKYTDNKSLLRNAANTIEGLSAAVEGYESTTNMVLTDEGGNTVIKFEQKWIPVTERLPEHGWYLAYGPTIKMEVLHFNSVEEVWSSERYYNIEVTHWMPLPKPPKEGE